MDDLVSIIMPMHNSEKYLEEAIRSVISQTYENWELLIIDDASTDNSLSIARYFESCDTRIHVLINDTPMGCPAIPRNVGIRRAKGRFIAFLDSDDVWLPCNSSQAIELPLFILTMRKCQKMVHAVQGLLMPLKALIIRKCLRGMQ